MILFHQLAIQELRQARYWYRQHSPDAAEQFMWQMDRTLARVLSDPESHAEIGRGYRHVKVKRFPYVVVYRLQSTGELLVVAVAHTRRRKGYGVDENSMTT